VRSLLEWLTRIRLNKLATSRVVPTALKKRKNPPMYSSCLSVLVVSAIRTRDVCRMLGKFRSNESPYSLTEFLQSTTYSKYMPTKFCFMLVGFFSGGLSVSSTSWRNVYRLLIIPWDFPQSHTLTASIFLDRVTMLLLASPAPTDVIEYLCSRPLSLAEITVNYPVRFHNNLTR